MHPNDTVGWLHNQGQARHHGHHPAGGVDFRDGGGGGAVAAAVAVAVAAAVVVDDAAADTAVVAV